MGLCAPNYNSEDINFKKWRKYMLNKDQKKVTVNQLEKRLNELLHMENSLKKQVALIGFKLYECLEEIEEIEDILQELKPSECDEK